ncbi:MAG: hypothetical protein RL719_93 [Actinomycetota bacterium]
MQLIHLRRAGVSVIFDTSANTPAILYWGAAVAEVVSAEDFVRSQLETTPPCDFDEPQTIGIWRENARGFLSRPTIIGSREGADFSQKFSLRATNRLDDHSVEFVSVDEHASLEVSAKFELSAAGILVISQSVTNLSIAPFNVESLTTFVPVADYVTESLDYTGRWLSERHPQRREIQTGLWTREGREGRTGHDYTLVQFALTQGTGYQNGEAWGLSLAWSGNNRHIVERTAIGRTSLGAGELLLPGEMVLGSGETYNAPSVWAVYSDTGIDGASSRFHQQIRARANHPTNIRPRPVTLNVWEAVYFDHNVEKLTALADEAQAIGVERFVLDDGWFGARRNDNAGLGDWVVSKDVWPNGLHPLVDAVRSRGMEFGLWFEGEMVNPDSDLYRAHPEWILHAGDRVPPEFRMQQVLDLAHPGAFDHVFDQTNAILNEYDISYIKWDHNRVLTEAGHLGKPAVHKQVEAIYRLFDALKAAHPGLEIESCSSGGGRIDVEMIQHADRFWTSDNNDALERQSIQRHTSIVIPPEMLGTHVGPTKAHSTGRTLSVSFRAATAIWGHAGLEWDLTTATAEEKMALKGFIDYYKANRDLLHSGRTVRVDQTDETSWTHGVVDQDASRAIFAHVALKPSQFSRPNNIRLVGLEHHSNYRVSVVEPAGAPGYTQITGPKWFDGVVLSGAVLDKIGLRAPVLRPEQALLIEAHRI